MMIANISFIVFILFLFLFYSEIFFNRYQIQTLFIIYIFIKNFSSQSLAYLHLDIQILTHLDI